MHLWTTKLVQHFIHTRFGVEYCRERVRQLLHALGFRLCRLRHCHLKAKAEEQDAFVAEREALLEEWPNDNILFPAPCLPGLYSKTEGSMGAHFILWGAEPICMTLLMKAQ
jgi:hypothetical protein